MKKIISVLKAIYEVFYVDSKSRYIVTQKLIDEKAASEMGEVKKDI